MCLSVATLEPVQVTIPQDLIEELQLPFMLTPKQIEVSKLLNTTNARNVMFEAVCGAGKTECVLELVKDRLNRGLKVGWAIPRRQVVIELQKRLERIFSTCTVIAVCEGYTSQLSADLVLFTTHQAFRYRGSFDVLILDEVDAYPYKDNVLLKSLIAKTFTQQCIMMSATIPLALRMQMRVENWFHVTCFERPTRVPLAIPKVIRCLRFWMILIILQEIQKQNKWLIFVPTRSLAQSLSFVLRCEHLTSHSKDKEEIIARFSQKECAILVCTTILERGVTFKNVHVIVYCAHHRVFDESSLVQIAGRVGRSIEYPKGTVLFLVAQESEEVNRCVSTLQNANHIAYGV